MSYTYAILLGLVPVGFYRFQRDVVEYCRVLADVDSLSCVDIRVNRVVVKVMELFAAWWEVIVCLVYFDRVSSRFNEELVSAEYVGQCLGRLTVFVDKGNKSWVERLFGDDIVYNTPWFPLFDD